MIEKLTLCLNQQEHLEAFDIVTLLGLHQICTCNFPISDFLLLALCTIYYYTEVAGPL